MTRHFISGLVIGLFIAFSIAGAEELEIHCINVGCSDCTLIISPSGKTMMVDTGLPFNASESHLCTYLRSIGVDTINYLVSTHYHRDHIGGIDTLIKDGIVIDSAFDRSWEYCKTDYYTYAAVVDSYSVRDSVVDGEYFDLGNRIFVTVVSVNGNGQLSPPYLDQECGGSYSENDLSIALLLIAGEFSFFVGGDLSGTNSGGYTDIESSLAGELTLTDVYRVNHHGSKYSSNSTFLDVLNPDVSIISNGSCPGSYTFPDSEVVNRLQALGSKIYMTSDSLGNPIDGDIVIRTDGLLYYDVEGLNGTDRYMIVDAEDVEPLPDMSFELFPNYPNPFNASTVIPFRLRQRSHVDLSVFDIMGRHVVTLVDKRLSSGEHSAMWDGRDTTGKSVASGIYFYRLEVEGVPQVRKMLLMK